MMSATQPCFEIGEHEVNDRQEGFRDLRIAPFRDSGVEIVALGKADVAAPIVGDDGGARRHGAFDEAAQRLGTSVRHQGKPDATSVPPGLALVETAGTLALVDFDGASHDDPVMHTAALAAGTAAQVGFIGLDDFSGLTANSVLIRSHHADAQLVKYLEGSLVARQSELPLELNSRYAGRLTGDQGRRPEPNRERCVRALHDGAGGKARIAAARPATEYARTRRDTVRLAEYVATRTDKPVAPADAFKIGRARRLIRKQVLKLRQRARERQIASLKHIDRHCSPRLMQLLNILPVVGVCDNPISTVYCS